MPAFDVDSFHKVDVDPSQPKHERLRAHLVRAIKDGQLRPGDAIPTETELALSTRMSRNTVRQALSHLEQNGLIRRVPGRGTFVHESASQYLKESIDLFALVLPDARSAYYPSLQRGFNEASSKVQGQVVVCETDNDLFRQADVLLQLMDRKVAGVAIVPITIPATSAHQIRVLHDQGVPVVFCHRRLENIQAPLITFSGPEVGQLAGKALLAKGHRRIAFFGGVPTKLAEQYEQGLKDTLDQEGVELPPEFIFHSNAFKITPEHEQEVQRNLEQLLKHPSPPTAIFCTFDSEAELVYLLLTQKGIRIPVDISLIGFGGTFRPSALAKRLTSVTVDEEELGRMAVKLLGEMRRGNRRLNDVTEIFMPLTVSNGETLGRNNHVTKDSSP